jgi:hypothetical protein
MFKYLISILLSPKSTWEAVANMKKNSSTLALLYPAILAALPAAAYFYGTTQVGWVVGDGDAVKFTEESAMKMIPLFYLTQVSAVAVIGWFIHWMSSTYGADSSLTKGIRIAGLTATPLFLAGIVGVYPDVMTNLILGLIAVSWATYLLYKGIPIVMRIPEERGFLFSSAIILICLTAIVGILVVSVILWDMGAAPAFTD